METIEARVCRVVSDVFGVAREQVTIKTSHDNVQNWTSLNILHLVMALEAEFGISITPDEAADFLSVELIIAVLKEKQPA